MGNRYRYAMIQETLFSITDIISIFALFSQAAYTHKDILSEERNIILVSIKKKTA